MNARVASILKDKIAAFTYVDRIAGLVRVISYERDDKVLKIPVATDVDDAYACDDSTQRDLVPDEQYACMVYFEDGGTTRTTSRTRGTSYRSQLRLVCWINTAKFSGDVTAADKILQEFLGVLDDRMPYNAETLIGIRQTVDGMPRRGTDIFNTYTYPESTRQYLMAPFDAFAIDLSVEYRIKPGCDEAPVPGDDSCWTPPVTKKRKNPRDFNCEELTDPVTGLTAEQLGPDCLNCEGGGPCPPTTVNGTESDVPDITVLRGGVEVGTLNPATGVHTVPECEDCDPLQIFVNTRFVKEVEDPCGASPSIDVLNELGAKAQTSIVGEQVIVASVTVLRDGLPYSTEVPGATVDVPSDCGTCDPATLSVNDTLVDTAADPCGHAFSLVVKNEDDTQVGSLVDGEWIVPTAKSLCALVTEGTSEEVAICVISSGKRAGVLAELIPTVPDGDVVAQVYDVMTVDQQAIIRDLFLFIKFVWQAGDADTYLWTVTADEAGTFTTYTPTGTNGTLTYSLNGGGYAALSGTIVLAVNDTIAVRRTTTTNAGSVKWEP